MTIYKDSIEALEDANTIIQKTFTDLKDIENHSNKINKNLKSILSNISEDSVSDAKVSELNNLLLNLYEDDRKYKTVVESTINYLEDHMQLVPKECDLFNETIAKSALNEKIKNLTEIEEAMEDERRKYCICQSDISDNMIACDNEQCDVEWYHYKCIGLTEQPYGDWICNKCREEESSK
ncbi:PHD finger domain protein [Spraguea lophii 42_110]|uniref:PHD finger domain protein n=1 Tax=Spraguea lophii (strain 42_110) TaxID=1358809 RepID=S7W9K8_SPRLO|nr:PHD finger domain protein [Spraguea lophii 42_110]